MASVIFLSFFFLIRLFMVGVLLQIAFADFVVVKYFVRLHKGGSAPSMLLHIKSIFLVIVGKIFIVGVLCNVVLIGKERAHPSKL